jgi:hypothetical protein
MWYGRSMIRVVLLTLFVLAFALTPLWLFSQLVMPDLYGLQQVYGNADATAQQVLQK